jgi:hypothetical protein
VPEERPVGSALTFKVDEPVPAKGQTVNHMFERSRNTSRPVQVAVLEPMLKGMVLVTGDVEPTRAFITTEVVDEDIVVR